MRNGIPSYICADASWRRAVRDTTSIHPNFKSLLLISNCDVVVTGKDKVYLPRHVCQQVYIVFELQTRIEGSRVGPEAHRYSPLT